MPQSVAEAWRRKPVCFASKCANFLVIRGPISACATRYVPCPQSPARALWPEYFCCHAGVPGVSFEKTFLCSRPSLCLSTWGVVCLALVYVVQCYMVRKLGPWLPTPFTGCVVTIVLWSAGFVGSSCRMTHQWTICMASYGYATLPFWFGSVGLGGLGMSCVPMVK